jgi:AraC family transcriptional regulator, ethanolamine operon transcriptional activator
MVNATLERQARIGGGKFNDIDTQAAQLHGYGQQYQQLSRGPFEGQFRSLIFGNDLSIHFETANRVLAQSSSTPLGRYGVCLLSEDSPSCTLNARQFSQNEVALCPESKFLEVKTPEGLKMCCIDLSRELLFDEGDPMRTFRVISDPSRSRQLWELAESGLLGFAALESASSHRAAIEEFKSSLADMLWQMAMKWVDASANRESYCATKRKLYVFRRARDYIYDGLPGGISIMSLCKNVGVSRRTLENIFQSVVGTGPGNYIRALQFNNIRRELTSNTNMNASIGAIAARWGVWHWSRFSSQYQLLFGELPSQTRVRHGSVVATKHGVTIAPYGDADQGRDRA